MSTTDFQEGQVATSPEQVQQLLGEGYVKCANQLCNYYVSPEIQDEVYKSGQHEFHCPHCGLTYNLFAQAGQHPDAEFNPGGRTKGGLNLKDMGDIGEDLIKKMGEVPGYGPLLWMHKGGASGNSAFDAIVENWGVEIKTLNVTVKNKRFIVDPKEREEKNRAAQDPQQFAAAIQDPELDAVVENMKLKGILGLLVMVDLDTSLADIYAKEMPHEWVNSQGRPMRGVVHFRQNTAHLVAQGIPFENPLPNPNAPGFQAPGQQQHSDDPFLGGGTFSSWKLGTDYAGDSHPGQEPQAVEDQNTNNWAFGQPPNLVGDETNNDPAEYQESHNFFYANGQLHVSPDHDHAELATHMGVGPDHTGPMASGEVTVINQKATWHVDTNVGLHPFFKILKDYTKHVGWRWGGMTDLEGQPINDEFAPKGSALNEPQAIVPPEPGTTPIPDGHVRLWHYTGATPEQIHQQGIRIQNAKGETYGEPNQIWASGAPPSFDNHNVVEFHVPINDPRWDIGKYEPWINYSGNGPGNPNDYVQNLAERKQHVTFRGDIRPDEITAVHEPWHQNYRYMMKNYPKETTDPNEFDWTQDEAKGGGPDLAKGVQAWKDTNWPVTSNWKLGEYPGGTNMMDRMKRHDPAGEDYELKNNGVMDPHQDFNPFGHDAPDDEKLRDNMICEHCHQKFHTWYEYTQHMEREEGPDNKRRVEDGHMPELPNMDAVIPPRFQDYPTFTEASWRLGTMTLPQEIRHWQGLAPSGDQFEVKHQWPDGYTVREHKTLEAVNRVGEAMHNCWQGVDPEDMQTGPYTDENEWTLPSPSWTALHDEHGIPRAAWYQDPQRGAIELKGQRNQDIVQGPLLDKVMEYAGQRSPRPRYLGKIAKDPKDSFKSPIPFIYDVHKNQVAAGFPGQRHGEIKGDFSPNGIVEAMYEPGGKVTIHTPHPDSSVYRMVQSWYKAHPHLEVTGVHLMDPQGKTKKLASWHLDRRIGGPGSPGPSYLDRYKKLAKDPIRVIKQQVAMDPAVDQAQRALANAGGQVHVVGGAVRDAIRGAEPKDLDLMVSGLPADVTRRTLEALPGRVDLTGKDFGVFRYRFKGHEVEIALPRRERSTGVGHQDFDVQADHTMSPEEDLARRDFTANAMAIPLSDSRIIDPFGGAEDIRNGRLRVIGENSLRDDPLRVVRALTANAKHGLEPDEDTRLQMLNNAGGLEHLPPERIQGELDKILSANNPARAMMLAHETGVLQYIIPEVDQNWDFDQNNPHHNYPLGEHLLHVLNNVSKITTDPDVRLAALLHDIGKPASAWTNPETGSTHYYEGPNGEGANHEKVGAQMAEDRLRALKFPNSTVSRVKDLINGHMYPDFSSLKGARKFLNRYDGESNGNALIDLREADRYGKGTDEYQDLKTPTDTQRALVQQVREQGEPVNQSNLAINGNDLINLGWQPGPQMGQHLRDLTQQVVEDPSLNNRDTLLQRSIPQ